MAAKVHFQANAQASAELKFGVSRRILAPVVLAAAVHGSVSLDVGGSLTSFLCSLLDFASQ